MSTLSVPLTPKLEETINQMVKNGVAENKASLVRQAVERFIEEKTIQDILEAQQELKQKKYLKGDIFTLSKKLNEKI